MKPETTAKERNAPKTIIGNLLVDFDLSQHESEIENEMHQEMLEQLHPLRGAELRDIFPVLQIFDKDEEE